MCSAVGLGMRVSCETFLPMMPNSEEGYQKLLYRLLSPLQMLAIFLANCKPSSHQDLWQKIQDMFIKEILLRVWMYRTLLRSSSGYLFNHHSLTLRMLPRSVDKSPMNAQLSSLVVDYDSSIRWLSFADIPSYILLLLCSFREYVSHFKGAGCRGVGKDSKR